MNLKPNEILELIRAGYTKEEITAMDVKEDPKPAEAEKQPEQEKEPETQPEPDKKKEDFSSFEEIVNKKFAELQNMIQETNRKNVDNPEPEQPKTLDAVTAVKQFFGDVE